jgi:hypothetical protein
MDDSERTEEFKVTDKRRFTSTGETRESEGPQPEPSEEQARQGAQTKPDTGAAETQTRQAQRKGTSARPEPSPPVNFSTFVVSLANTALFQMGYLKVEDAQEPPVDLVGARQTIDLLGVLQEKTVGNLTDEEKKLLTETLFQLRMAFVESSRKS